MMGFQSIFNTTLYKNSLSGMTHNAQPDLKPECFILYCKISYFMKCVKGSEMLTQSTSIRVAQPCFVFQIPNQF